MSIWTRERLDLRYEAWRLYDKEKWSYSKIAQMQNRNRSTVAADVAEYRASMLPPEERAAYEAAVRPWAKRRKRVGSLVPKDARCERCQSVRDECRIEGMVNPNADVLCDDCHVALMRGKRHTDGELSIDRLVELGCKRAGKARVA